jgi:hypothetical protein
MTVGECGSQFLQGRQPDQKIAAVVELQHQKPLRAINAEIVQRRLRASPPGAQFDRVIGGLWAVVRRRRRLFRKNHSPQDVAVQPGNLISQEI